MRVRLGGYLRKIHSQKTMSSIVIAISLLVLFLVFLSVTIVYRYYLLQPVSLSVNDAKKRIKPGLPNRLIINSINIDASIDYVGLRTDGAMDIKPNPKVVGWYMLGPRPGDKGNAVIAGHYGWQQNGEPAVFNDIQKLNEGDELSIIDQNGLSITFVVREIRKYNPDADATTVFKSSDDRSHLNLITCNGVWVNDKRSYSNRLVVFTDKK